MKAKAVKTKRAWFCDDESTTIVRGHVDAKTFNQAVKSSGCVTDKVTQDDIKYCYVKMKWTKDKERFTMTPSTPAEKGSEKWTVHGE